jgi:hypothetical protein
MRAVRESLVSKIAARFHLSRQKVRATLLWDLEGIFGPERRPGRARRVPAGAKEIARELDLTPEEVAFLLDTAPDDPRVAAILGMEREEPTAEPPETGPEEPPPDRASQRVSEGAGEPTKKPVQRRLGEFSP